MAYPTLNSNEIFSGLYNMIISQTVFSENLSGLKSGFVDQFRVDGSLYGDTKLYYAADVLPSYEWLQDTTPGSGAVTNVLALHRPSAPDVQAITLNKFRQIALTVDNYLSKRAWGSEGAFAEFNSVMLGMIAESKAVYDYTTLATFIGTEKSAETTQNITVTPGAGVSDAQAISKAIADLMVQLQRPSRAYNDHKNMRAYSPDRMEIIWNSDFVNQMRNIDEPMLRQINGGNIINPDMSNVLAPEYFGDVVDSTKLAAISASTPTTGKPIDSDDGSYVPGTNHANGIVRSLVEKDVTVSSVAYHVYPGDEIPAGATVGSSKQFGLSETYVPNAKVICKVMHKDSVPYMSAFEVGTSFFNARNLSENHYLTWGHNTLTHLKQYPYITVTHS